MAIMQRLSTFATLDPTECLGWAYLPDAWVRTMRELESEMSDLSHNAWTKMTADRTADLMTGAVVQRFAVNYQAGYCVYELSTIVSLPSGSEVAIFRHVGMLGDIIVKKFPTGDFVLRLDVTGGRNHISVRAETIAGRVVYATAIALTRWLNIKQLKASMLTALLAAGEISQFQDLKLHKFYNL